MISISKEKLKGYLLWAFEHGKNDVSGKVFEELVDLKIDFKSTKKIRKEIEGCGNEFIFHGEDVSCGDEFEFEGECKVILCPDCQEKMDYTKSTKNENNSQETKPKGEANLKRLETTANCREQLSQGNKTPDTHSQIKKEIDKDYGNKLDFWKNKKITKPVKVNFVKDKEVGK